MDRAKYKENYYLLLISFEKYTIIAITQKAVVYLHNDTYQYNIYDNKSTKKGEAEGQNCYISPESSHH